MYRNAVAMFLLGWLLPALTGCSGNGLVPVTGEVTVNGTPLKSGTINFYSDAGQKGGPSAGTVIKEGKYSVAVVSGHKSVEILGYKTIGRKHAAGPESPMVDILEQTLPARYNAKTELSVDINPDVSTHDFSLQK